MTVTTTSSSTGLMAGDASNASWPFSFPVQSADQVRVIFRSAAGSDTTLSASVYSLALSNSGRSGGTVTYPLAGDPVAANESITIRRTVAYTQPTNLRNQGSLAPETVEAVADRCVYQIQQLSEEQSRVVLVPEAETGPMELPSSTVRANKVLGFDSDGDPVAVAAPEEGQYVIDGNFTSSLDDAVLRTIASKLGDVVSVKDFGAVGDGLTDDTEAIMFALESGAGGVYVPSGTYLVTNLMVRSGTSFYGDGPSSVLKTTSNSPCVASRNWYSAKNVGAAGYTRIHDLAIRGDNNQTKSSQHGIVLRDYYSDLYNLHLVDLGGSAIRLVAKDDNGDEIVGNLVENSIRDIRIERCRGINPLYLGETDVTALTDGILQNVFLYAYRTGSNTNYTLFRAGRAAGWVYANVHMYCYGTSAVYPVTAMHLNEAWATHLSNIYIEEFQDTGIYIAATGQVSLSNVLLRGEQINAAGTASALYVDATGAEAYVSVHGLSVHKDTSTYNVYCLNGEAGVLFYSGTPNRAGAQRATITPTGTGGASYNIGGNGFYASGSGTPVGSVTPRSIGDQYLDTGASPKKWYKSVGLTTSDWVALN